MFISVLAMVGILSEGDTLTLSHSHILAHSHSHTLTLSRTLSTFPAGLAGEHQVDPEIANALAYPCPPHGQHPLGKSIPPRIRQLILYYY